MRYIVIVVALFLAAPSFSQSGSKDSSWGGRVKSDKPTVYLEYVCQNNEMVYLRMYNNTTWHVSVPANELYYPSKTPIKLENGVSTYAAPNDRRITLQYRIEKYASPWEDVKVPKIAYPDNSFSNWIASQDSILFSVPIEYLRKDLQVFVRYNYEWEITKKGYTINDPEHRVYFRGIDLSTKPVACKQ